MEKEKKLAVRADELLEVAAVKDKRQLPPWARSKFYAFLALILFSSFGIVIVSSLAAPPTLVTAGTVEKATEWWENLPSSLSEVPLPQRAYMVDRDGKRVATFYSEDRVVIPYKKMGKNVINALIATEDSRFWEHKGLDAQGVGRAFVNNILGDSTQGASTVTQQLVENIRLRTQDEETRQTSKTQTMKDKLEELRYALAIEKDYSKKEILEAYLNIVYFGNNAYGIEAAAQRYYSAPAKDLTVPQAATLVAMLKSPIGYDPIKKKKKSRQRRDVVMKRMVETGYLTQKKYKKFAKKKTPLKVSTKARGCGAATYPFYCQMVLNEIKQSREFGKNRKARQRFIDYGGWTLTLAYDRKAMDSAQAAVDAALGRGNQFATSTVMMEPGTGNVLGMAQNRSWGTPENDGDFEKTQIVYADSPHIQVGSAFKLITAVAALEEGYSAKTLFNSPSPAYFPGLDAPPGGFKNSPNRGYGSIDLATAFKYSVNTYFVGVGGEVGVKDVAAMARRLGMKSMPENLSGREGSISLGSYETSPLQLATVYASVAARGMVCQPVMILSGETVDGEPIRVPSGECHQEVSPAVMDSVSYAMEAPFEDGGTAARVRLDRRATGKTGTTQNHAAVLFAGYTPQLATAVWVGDPRGGFAHPVQGIWAHGYTHGTAWGGTVPGPIWRRVMTDFHRGKKKLWYPKPGGVSASMTSRIVPEVRGLDLDAAVTLLLKSGFKVKVQKKTAREQENLKETGYVWNQSPAAGGKMAYGDTVSLVLTHGSDTRVRIPATFEDLAGAATNKVNPTARGNQAE